MIPASLALSPRYLAVALALGYLAVGARVAVQLSRAGRAAAAAAALVAWPLLLPALNAPGPSPRDEGPMAERIDAALRALRAAMAEPGAPAGALSGLESALRRADARLGRVDRTIDEIRRDAEAARTDPAAATEIARGLAQLQAAREQTVAEIEAVLAGVVQLRIQVGLLALAGDTTPVRERLMELTSRVRALEEVARFNVPTRAAPPGDAPAQPERSS